MKILHLIGASQDVGGVLSSLRTMISGWPGTDAHYVLVRSDFAETRRPQLQYRRLPHILDESENALDILMSTVRSFRALYELIQNESFDIIHAHHRGMYPALVALSFLQRKPCVATFHMYARRTLMYQWVSRFSRVKVVLLTKAMKAHYRLSRTLLGEVEDIPECIDLQALSPPQCPPREGKTLRLVGAGSLLEWKGWHILLQALSLCRTEVQGGLKIEIYGDSPTPTGQYKAELLNYTLENQLSDIITFRGFLPSVLEHVGQADWFILPSINEPCSVAILEALALGVPVIASDSGGNVDIIKHGINGVLFETGSSRSLADTLLMCLRSEIPRPHSCEVRATVKSFDKMPVATSYRSLYLSLLESAR